MGPPQIRESFGKFIEKLLIVSSHNLAIIPQG
jgi:hypothetical protein